jgi:hypothetical protein
MLASRDQFGDAHRRAARVGFMARLTISRDGRTALSIVAGGVVAALVIWLGFFGFTGWLVDSGDRQVGQTLE